MISILPLALVSIFSSPALFATMFRPFEGFLEVTEKKTKQMLVVVVFYSHNSIHTKKLLLLLQTS